MSKTKNNYPGLTIFGIQETNKNKNKFQPHYYILHKMFKGSRIHHVNPSSVMFTGQAFNDVDFWNLDNDFFFMEDMLSWQQVMNNGGPHFDYFSGFLRAIRIAHSLFEDVDQFSSEWTKNRAHVMDVYTSMMACDIIMVSPVLKEIFDRSLKAVFSKKLHNSLNERMLILPPPDMYKFDPWEGKKSFKKLSFLWNHRITVNKNPKAFFGIISEFHKRYPKIPIEVVVLSSLTESEVLGHVPENIHKYIVQKPFAQNEDEYKEALLGSNITLGVSKLESYGISIFDSVKHGLVVLNLPCNEAFSRIVGTETTFSEKEMPEIIHKVYDDPKVRKKILTYNMDGFNTITSKEEYKKSIRKHFNKVLQERLDKTVVSKGKIFDALKVVEKRVCRKQDLYEAMGWKLGNKPLNAFWGDYYYKLRKLGVNTVNHEGVVYYYIDQFKVPKDHKPWTPPAVRNSSVGKTMFD